MGKKGSWFSAIKRVFGSNSKDKIANEAEEIRNKKKNKGAGKLRHGERKSFIPLFREPSSIEKILGEAERELNISFRPLTPTPTPPPDEQQQQTLRQPEQQLLRTPAPFVPPSHPLPLPPPAVVPPRAASPRQPSPRAASPKFLRNRPEPTLRNQHASATKIQAAYRGYMARRSFRALRGLVRLQGVVKGHNVKRQTMNAMKYMQMLVRVQSQIQSRRIQMLETQARDQTQYKEDDSKFSLVSEGGNDNWDDSVLTKEEADARLQRKVEAIMKREKAMAYAYSNQLWKSTQKSTHTASNLRSGGVPWWWTWLEKQLPQQTLTDSQTPKSYRLTPSRPNSESKQRPRPISSSTNNYSNKQQQQRHFFENTEAATPRSSRSSIIPSRLAQTPPSGRTPLFGISSASKYSRSRAGGGDSSPFGGPLRDDDSLLSCPPFSVPNYMVPTVSAQAKARPNSNPRERFPSTPGSESSRRSSFPMTQMGSYKWNKGSFSGKDSSSLRTKGGLDKNQTRESMDTKSVDSTVSLPVGVGRKPFNRFV